MNLMQKFTLCEALSQLKTDPSAHFKSRVLTPDLVSICAEELLKSVAKLNWNADPKAMPKPYGNFEAIVLRRAMRMAALELRRAARQLELGASA